MGSEHVSSLPIHRARQLDVCAQDFQVHFQQLSQVKEEWKDETYHRHISVINQLQQEVLVDNPIVGFTNGMPPSFSNGLFHCRFRECAAGNLQTDALR